MPDALIGHTAAEPPNIDRRIADPAQSLKVMRSIGVVVVGYAQEDNLWPLAESAQGFRDAFCLLEFIETPMQFNHALMLGRLIGLIDGQTEQVFIKRREGIGLPETSKILDWSAL